MAGDSGNVNFCPDSRNPFEHETAISHGRVRSKLCSGTAFLLFNLLVQLHATTPRTRQCGQTYGSWFVLCHSLCVLRRFSCCQPTPFDGPKLLALFNVLGLPADPFVLDICNFTSLPSVCNCPMFAGFRAVVACERLAQCFPPFIGLTVCCLLRVQGIHLIGFESSAKGRATVHSAPVTLLAGSRFAIALVSLAFTSVVTYGHAAFRLDMMHKAGSAVMPIGVRFTGLISVGPGISILKFFSVLSPIFPGLPLFLEFQNCLTSELQMCRNAELTCSRLCQGFP